MGRGRSKANGAVKTVAPTAKTPSGLTFDDFQKLSDSEKVDAINRIIDDSNIKVPYYLDSSDTSKVMYALGMDKKPTIVTDKALDAMPGKEIFRTVYEGGTMPPPSSKDILDQIRSGDYTQMSGSGGSAYGRALYFATNVPDSASYGKGRRNPQMLRAKIDPTAKIRAYTTLYAEMKNDTGFQNKIHAKHKNGVYSADSTALYAIYKGFDGWYSGTYSMLLNRGVLAVSDTSKVVNSSYTSRQRSWKHMTNAT